MTHPLYPSLLQLSQQSEHLRAISQLPVVMHLLGMLRQPEQMAVQKMRYVARWSCCCGIAACGLASENVCCAWLSQLHVYWLKHAHQPCSATQPDLHLPCRLHGFTSAMWPVYPADVALDYSNNYIYATTAAV